MNRIHIAMMILSAWRLTEIVTQDVIFNRPRAWWAKRFSGRDLANFVTCPRCVSVWAGGLSVVLFYFVPYANWPLGLSMSFIIASVVMGHIQTMVTRENQNPNHIVIKPDLQRVEWGMYGKDAGVQILNQVLQALNEQPERKKR